MLEIAKMVRSDSGVSITELDGFTDDNKEKLFVALRTLKNVLRPALIFHNWVVAYDFFNENISRLLSKKTEIRYDFILYQLKIILNAGLEFTDTMKRYLIHQYPESEKRQNLHNKKWETRSEGEWIFKDLSAKVYDENFSYRLCYNLRNCMQHVGPEGIAIEHNEHGYKITLNKSEYINGHDGIQEKFKRELIALSEEKIDVISAINLYNQNISELFKKIEKVYRCKNMRDELYSSLIITTLLPYEESNLVRYAILNRNNTSHELDSLNFTVNYIQIKKASEFVEMHCKYFLLRGTAVTDELDNPFPYQINDSTFYAGNHRVKANGMSYVKIEEGQYGNQHYIIYLLECLFPEEQLAIQSAIKEFIVGN